MAENGVYPQWNSHLVGIMISKTIGCRGTLFSDKHIILRFYFLSTWPLHQPPLARFRWLLPAHLLQELSTRRTGTSHGLTCISRTDVTWGFILNSGINQMMIHESIIVYIDTQSWFSNHDDWFSVTKFIPNLSQSQSNWSSAPWFSTGDFSPAKNQRIQTEKRQAGVSGFPCRMSKKWITEDPNGENGEFHSEKCTK